MVHSGGKMQKAVSRSQEAEKRLERQLIHRGRQGPHCTPAVGPATVGGACLRPVTQVSSPAQPGWTAAVTLLYSSSSERPTGMFSPDNPKGPPSYLWGYSSSPVNN